MAQPWHFMSIKLGPEHGVGAILLLAVLSVALNQMAAWGKHVARVLLVPKN